MPRPKGRLGRWAVTLSRTPHALPTVGQLQVIQELSVSLDVQIPRPQTFRGATLVIRRYRRILLRRTAQAMADVGRLTLTGCEVDDA